MDAISLKKYIFENNQVEYVLEKIGCRSIKYHTNKDFWSCCNYNGDNASAVNVRNNSYLNVINWTREKEFDKNSDIIFLTQYNKQCSFVEAMRYLHGILGLEYKWQPKRKQKTKDVKQADPLHIFKKTKSKRKVDVADIRVLNEELLNDFIPLLYIGWYREGIMPWTRKKFGLAYSYKYKRVVIPHRHWLTGELLGMNMRTVVDNYEVFGIKKYFVTPSYQKHLNLYGLYENYDAIQKAGYVIVVEGDKSVLKRDSLCDNTVVSLSGKSMSDEQARILIGLNVEVIIALDKDVCINEVRWMCEKFYRIRSVSYICDKWDLLEDKDSPADASSKDYQFLFKHRVKYGESEHRKYLKSLEKR